MAEFVAALGHKDGGSVVDERIPTEKLQGGADEGVPLPQYKKERFSSFALVGITFIIGTVIGVLSGYYGGIVESVFMRITDIILSFPNMIIAIVIAGVMGGSLRNAMIALGVTSWTQYARIAKSSILKVKEEMYVHAAEIMGNSSMPGMYTIVVADKKGRYNKLFGSLVLTTDVQPVKYSADAKKPALLRADGATDKEFKNYIKNITGVVVDGKNYSAGGKNAVVTVKSDGSIDVFADSLAKAGKYDVTVRSTGYPDLVFNYDASTARKAALEAVADRKSVV